MTPLPFFSFFVKGLLSSFDLKPFPVICSSYPSLCFQPDPISRFRVFPRPCIASPHLPLSSDSVPNSPFRRARLFLFTNTNRAMETQPSATSAAIISPCLCPDLMSRGRAVEQSRPYAGIVISHSTVCRHFECWEERSLWSRDNGVSRGLSQSNAISQTMRNAFSYALLALKIWQKNCKRTERERVWEGRKGRMVF